MGKDPELNKNLDIGHPLYLSERVLKLTKNCAQVAPILIGRDIKLDKNLGIGHPLYLWEKTLSLTKIWA